MSPHYSFQFCGGINYPQKSLSTINNRAGVLQELRRAMNSIYDKNNRMITNHIEFGKMSTDATTPTVPAKFWVGVNLQKLTVAQKTLFMGVSTSNSPISVIINIGTQTAQLHNVMLILNYEALIEIDTTTRQCQIAS